MANEESSYQELRNAVVKKYLAEGESSWEDIKTRLIKNIPKDSKYDKLRWFIGSELIIPAGSILRGWGAPDYTGSFSNCYYIPIERDSIEGIFDTATRMARLYTKRGGVGIDISILRPKGASVNNSAKKSSGAVSFMPLFSQVTGTIGQEGRRGALLISMDVNHPDILDFIRCKSEPDRVFETDTFGHGVRDVNFANISVKLTDEFMEAVRDDADWDLKFPDIEAVGVDKYTEEWDGDYDKWDEKYYPFKVYATLPARSIFRAIAEAAHKTGDPGVLFPDDAKLYAPASYIDSSLVPIGTNP